MGCAPLMAKEVLLCFWGLGGFCRPQVTASLSSLVLWLPSPLSLPCQLSVLGHFLSSALLQVFLGYLGLSLLTWLRAPPHLLQLLLQCEG